jgi:catechol 2,3-dioxygenase-like lactoylglutathione lyase family enzyme
VVNIAIGISVADTIASLAFYEGLLKFDVRETRPVTESTMQLFGLDGGGLLATRADIPGSDAEVVFLEFSPPAGTTVLPFHWRIQDVGAPQFQLQVSDMDSLLESTRKAGFQFLSVDGKPIQRDFGRFVFAIDADGVLVEYVEPEPSVPDQAPK